VKPADVPASLRGVPFQTVWETDPQGKNTYESPSWYRYVGEGPDSEGEKGWLRFYHPDDRERVSAEWRGSLAEPGGRPYDMEARIRRHDGVYRLFRIRGTPLFDASGRVLKWSGTCTDIEDAKSADSDAPRSDAAAEGRAAREGWRQGLFRLGRELRLSQLERRLFFIIFAGLLPLVLLSFFALLRNAEGQRQDVVNAATDTLRAVMTAVDSELEISRASLDALASSRRLAHHDFTGFREEAGELLVRRPSWVNVVLSTTDGQQVVNARLPARARLPRDVDPDSVRRVAETGNPVIGDITFSPALRAHVFAVYVPVAEDGRVPYVLSAQVRPDAIRDILIRQEEPEGVAAIFDRGHHEVARTPARDEWVGKLPSPDFLKLLDEGGQSGWGPAKTREGLAVYSVFYRSSTTGWVASVGIPSEQLDAPVRRSYAVFGGSIAISVILGFLAAFALARTIVRPMRELAHAAEAVGSGHAPEIPHTRLPEIREAALALAAAHIEREKLLQGEQEARLLAEDASRSKDEFLAMLAHELRNPLAAIRMASHLLDHAPPGDPAGSDAREIVRRQTRHLTRLTDDLLDAGRVMMGKVSLQRKPVDLGALVARSAETLRNGLPRGVKLELEIQPAWVEADAIRIDQVVSNLLANAAKFTPPPGFIRVSVALEDGEAVLRVRDSGLGMERDLVPRVFELFVQGQRSLDRSSGGLGIGLTLVKRMTELHGGSVEAKSEGPGKGSEFIVRLPAVNSAGDTAGSSGSIPAAGSARTIVVVDDNADVRNGLRGLLELDGHHVLEASDGPSAVELILREHPDLALVDIGLPGLDGYGVARAVREQSPGTVRLVALTGYGAQDDIDRGLASGFDAYLVKPVDFDVLNRLVVELPA
jgi:PAS domain S-box-containing protein